MEIGCCRDRQSLFVAALSHLKVPCMLSGGLRLACLAGVAVVVELGLRGLCRHPQIHGRSDKVPIENRHYCKHARVGWTPARRVGVKGRSAQQQRHGKEEFAKRSASLLRDELHCVRTESFSNLSVCSVHLRL